MSMASARRIPDDTETCQALCGFGGSPSGHHDVALAVRSTSSPCFLSKYGLPCPDYLPNMSTRVY
jgi:hypothetical protein